MQVPNFLRPAALLLYLSFSLCSSAQSLSAAQKTAAIEDIAKLIATNYVLPEKGGQIASHIQIANFKGEFNRAKSWDDFDRAVTNSLQKYSGDKHLYLKNDPEVVKNLRAQTKAEKGMMHVGVSKKEDNHGIGEAKILEGNIGYLRLTSIEINDESLPVLYEAMRKLENTNALVIDLRDNGGGESEKGPVIESYFLPANTPLLDFTSRNGVMRTDSTVNWLTEKKYTKPVYILVNKNTASAAEALAFVLQQKKRAKIAGETSAGAAYMNDWFILNDDNYVSVSTSSPSLHGTTQTWEGTGIEPDIRIKKGDALAVLLEKISRS
jgi:C-terminal processing protease CtpA/Prc